MSTNTLYPRFVEPRLVEALTDSPVVLIHGPRQSGKTTLAQIVGEPRGYTYINFDDDVVRAAAQIDPLGFVADLPDRVILDEVQWVPELFTALKTEVDRNRIPGRFMLTGSTNIMLMPKLSDSLAGRMEILRLYPLTQCELERRPSGFLNTLFAGGFKIHRGERLAEQLAERITAGGYPAALARTSSQRRSAWYRDYIDALVQRDVRDLTRISSLTVLPRLLTATAAETARLINISELAAPFQLSRPTIRDYVTLLERIFLLEELPPWYSNRLRRLIKTPKLHIGDTGLASALLGMNAPALHTDRPLLGQLLETFVFQELRRQAGWYDDPLTFFHYRDKDGVEVDIIIERSSHTLVGVEVKAAATVNAADFRGLRKLRDSIGERFAGGAVLYDGETTTSFGDRLFAVPVRALWEI